MKQFNPFSFWIPVNMYFGNSEDSDGIPHNVGFHQGLHCLLLKIKTIFGAEKHFCRKFS